MALRYGDKEQVKGGTLKRAKRRARRLGRGDVLEGGVTGREARKLKSQYKRDRGNKDNVHGPIAKRARGRLDEIGPVGGVNPRDGISRPEARKVRKAWQTERRFDPLRPRNGRDIKSEADALADLEYGPQERELTRAGKMESGRANTMASWFNDYQQQVAQMSRETQIANQAFQTGAAQAAQGAFQADTAGVGARQQQAGSDVDPSVYAGAQQAAGARQQQGIAFSGALGQIGQASTALMQQRAVGAGQQRIEVLADSQARSRRIEELQQELTADKGLARTKYAGALKDSERSFSLEKSAFGLDVAKERFDQSDARADNRRMNRSERRHAARDKLMNKQTRVNIRKTQGEIGLDRTADRADDGKLNNSTDFDTWSKRNDGKGGGSDSFTPTQVRGNRSSFENGRNIAYQHRGKGYDWLYNSMVEKNYDSLMAKVIAMKATRRRIPRALLNRFERRYGFRPSARGKGPAKSRQHVGTLTPRNPDGTPG